MERASLGRRPPVPPAWSRPAGRPRANSMTSRPNPRSDRRPPQARIVAAATILFDERGYHGTRMADIASRLGMRAPSLYNYVSSKQALLRLVMFQTMEALLEEHLLVAAGGGSVIERLRGAMEAHVRHCARNRAEMRILGREVPSLEEPERAALLALRSEYGLRWSHLLDEGVAAEGWQVRDTRLAANAVIQMGVGAALWLRPLPLSESELATALAEMVLSAVGIEAPDLPAEAPAEAVREPPQRRS
jgi:AcrR family transcriptional regulator